MILRPPPRDARGSNLAPSCITPPGGNNHIQSMRGGRLTPLEEANWRSLHSRLLYGSDSALSARSWPQLMAARDPGGWIRR